MSKTTRHVSDRSLLRFSEEVKVHFAFLEAQGFRCVGHSETLVRFEMPGIVINIYHGRQSYEIGLELESPESATDHFAFSELLCLIDQKKADHYKVFASHNAQGVSDGVRELAESFQHCIAGGILNDDQFFSRLKLQRQELIKKYALDVQLQQARRKADVAWHNKDYSAVVKTMFPLRCFLSPSEIAKLEFAERHLQRGSA